MPAIRRALAIAAAAGCVLSAAPAGAATGCGRDLKVRGADVCLSRTDERGARVYGTVRGVAKQQGTKATLFAVHSGDRRIAEGAIGESLRGLPARRDMHFRVGNITEGFTTSLLLQLVDEGRIKLSDPVSRYDRRIPYADKIQVGMLARITSGLADYVTEPDFVAANNADPFRRWTTSELLAYSARKPPVFAPGTSARFSDTGFVLLGDILARAGRAPLAEQLQRRIFKPLKLRNTRMNLNGNIQSPVLHAFTSDRGTYEESTFWDPTWVTNAANMTSSLHDISVWARAIGRGTVVSPAAHRLQTGPINVGLGFNTADRHYGMGVLMINGWILTNPQVGGYNIISAYEPSKKLTVVVVSTLSPTNSPTTHYSTIVFRQLARMLIGSMPNLPANPRPNG